MRNSIIKTESLEEVYISQKYVNVLTINACYFKRIPYYQSSEHILGSYYLKKILQFYSVPDPSNDFLISTFDIGSFSLVYQNFSLKSLCTEIQNTKLIHKTFFYFS